MSANLTRIYHFSGLCSECQDPFTQISVVPIGQRPTCTECFYGIGERQKWKAREAARLARRTFAPVAQMGAVPMRIRRA